MENNNQELENNELITEEALELIRRVLHDAPIETDDDLTLLGKIYED